MRPRLRHVIRRTIVVLVFLAGGIAGLVIAVAVGLLRVRIFEGLVKDQDSGYSPLQSRQRAAKRFHVTEAVVKRIEDEGIEQDWPLAHPP
jgi:hypothetical protein